MHYILEVPKYTNIVYIQMYLVLAYIQRLFSTVCYFLRYFCWSVNCLSQSSQLIPQFFSAMLGNWGKVYIWELLVLSFTQSSIPTFQYFFSFFYLVCKLFSSLFSHFSSVSKLCELNLWIMSHIPEMSRSLNWKFYWNLLVLLFMQNLILTFSHFFWSVNWTSLVHKLYLLFTVMLDLRVVLNLEVFSNCMILWRVSFNS